MSDSVQPYGTVACQAPLSMGFCRQEYLSGLPCPPPGDLLDSEIEPTTLASPALEGSFFFCLFVLFFFKPLPPPGNPQMN